MKEDAELKNFVLKYVKNNYVAEPDNPLDALPHFVVPKKFYVDQYNEYKIKLEKFKNLTDKEAKQEEIAWRKEQLDAYEKYIDKLKCEIERMTILFKKVENWECPESLKKIKEYMLKDISYVISSHDKLMKLDPCIDPEINGKEFKKQMIERYQGLFDSYKKNVEKNQDHANGINKMLKDLKDDFGDW